MSGAKVGSCSGPRTKDKAEPFLKKSIKVNRQFNHLGAKVSSCSLTLLLELKSIASELVYLKKGSTQQRSHHQDY